MIQDAAFWLPWQAQAKPFFMHYNFQVVFIGPQQECEITEGMECYHGIYI